MKRIKKIILFVLCLFATQIYAAPSVEYSTKSPINGDVKITIKLDKDATLPASSGWKLVRPPEVKLKYNPTTQGYFKVFQGNINKINDGILERDEYGIKWVNSRSLYLNFNQKVDISKVIFYNKSSNYHTFENIGAWDRIRGSIFSFNDWSNKTLYSFKFPAKNNHRIIYIDPKKYVENIKNIQLWFKGSYQNMNEIEVYGHIHTKKEYTKTVSVNESGKVEFTEEGPQAKKINIYYSVSNIDKTKPTITLNGTNPQKVERATSYTEAGFNCTDNVSCTKKTTGSVDVNKIGNYTITYTATDPAGNITTKTRAVIVEDTKDYTVTFNTNGGSTITTKTTKYNTSVTKPTDPTKTGHTFGGWFKDSALKNTFNFTTEKITSNTTVYAKWITKDYTVTFNTNGGSTITTKTTKYNTSVTKPTDPTKTGHTFGGWFKDSALKNTFNFTTEKITSNTTVYAKWITKDYTVTFNTNGGSTITTKTTKYNTSVTKPTDPTKTGHTFGGWFKDSALKNTFNFTTEKITSNTTVYAKWITKDYTVTFNTNGGSTITTKTTKYNTSVTKPTDPTKTGHTFGGWFKDSALKNTFNFTTEKITSNTTVYAKWITKDYTVTFNTNGGSTITTKTTKYNTSVTKPTDPTKTGHTFGGWFKDSALKNTFNFTTEKITSNTTVYAKWITKDYTVTFNTNGGSTITTKTTKYNTSVTKPTDPTKTGHTFGGWFKDSALKNTFNFTTEKITSNTTVYAKWITKDYTVTFNTNGGSTITTKTTKYNTSVTKPTDPTKTGHTFGGWFKDSALKNTFNFTTEKITSNTTVYAKWITKDYTVTFNTNGGSTITTKTTKYNTSVTKPTDPTKTGHTFGGWFKDSALKNTFNFTTEKITSNTTVYAKWITKDYTVTFNTNGGSTITTKTTKYNTSVTKPTDPTKTGHTFGGWFKDSALKNTFNFTTEKITSNTTVYAKWITKDYTVTFNTNGGSTITTKTTKYNTSVTKPTDPTKTGHTFGGWFKDSALKNTFNFTTEKITSNTTVYAKWITKDYTVTFNTNGGSTITTKTTKYNTSVTKPTDPTKTGHTFGGWFKDSALKNTFNFTTEKITSNTTVYAKWITKDYTVTFNTNGGSTITTKTTKYNTSVTKPTDPTKTGHTFGGWFKDSALKNTFNFTTEKITSNTTVYAKWITKDYTVTFNTNGGSTITTKTTKYNTSVTKPTDPTKTGHTFGGWFKDSALKNTFNFTTEKITSNTTVYAKWITKDYTVTFNTNGGSTITTKTTKYNTSVTKPTDPTKTGHTFGGWFKDSALKNTFNFTTEKITSNTTVYAKWITKDYTVTFNTNGGSTITTKTTKYNTSVTKPTDPTKTGHTFGGWFKDSALKNTFNFTTEKITSNTTVYAKWITKDYTVTFNTNGGSTITTKTTKYNTSVTKPTDPTKTGHTFGGWFKDSALKNTFNFTTEKITSNTTVYAKWITKDYTVTFNTNGGSTITTKTTKYNTSVTKPTDPTKTGHTFGGWFKDSALKNTFNFTTEKITSNTTVYAKWITKDYTVTFNTNGGSTITTKTTKYNTSVTKPTDPTKTGHTFGGWFKDSALKNTFNFTTEKITSNTTVYAKWITKDYTVTFNTNGGSTITTKTTKYNTSVTKPTDPTKTGHTFGGWFKDSALKNTFNFTTEKITSNTTVYAKWITKDYTVTFNTNGGSTITTKTTKYNTSVTKPTDPTKTGHTFGGWFKDSALKNTFNFTTEKITSNTTVYAKWITKDYTVTFNTNGGSTITTKTTKYNTSVTKPTDPTKTGHTFGGWFKDSALKNTFNFTTEKITSNTTVYAKWIDTKAPTATVSYSTTKPTDKDVVVTLIASEDINTPSGWTKVNSKEFTKTISVNTSGDVNVSLTDKTGNKGTVKYNVSNIDKTKPIKPTIKPSNGDKAEGTAEANSEIEVTDSKGNTLCKTTTDSKGNYQCNLNPKQSDGETITVKSKDKAGNESTESIVIKKKNNNNNTNHSSSFTTQFTCKDKKAINYDRFGRHKQSLCKYKNTIDNPLNGNKCINKLIITDNLINPSTDGRYSAYNKGKVTQVKILQSHINRILKDEYKQAAGPIDGYYRTKTKRGVKRLQTKLNIILKGKIKPLTVDGIVGPYTKQAINYSC